MILEPIPALDALKMSLKMAKLPDEQVASAVLDLEARMKATKSSDGAGWAAIYRGWLAALPMILAAQERLDAGKADSGRAQAQRQKLASLGTALPARLQKAAMDWPARLAEQVRELSDKAERSVQKLSIEGTPNANTGETDFRVEATQLEAFFGWMGRAEATWVENNGKLCALRANEAIADLVRELPAGLSFEVAPPDLALPRSSAPPRLKGLAIPTPGRFEALGATYKMVMSAVMGVSGVGFIASRYAGPGLQTVLPWAFGIIFLLSGAYAAVTVPTQRRQALARLAVRAEEHVHRELVAAIRERLDRASEAQLAAVRKHLAGEERRAATALRELEVALGSPSAPAAFGLGGLSPQDVGKLRGEWRAGIEARLRELEG